MADKKLLIFQNLKVEGVDCGKLKNISISHRANEYAGASLNFIVDEKKAADFLKKANADKVKISLNNKVLFQGFISNLILRKSNDTTIMTVGLFDAAWKLNWKAESKTFQKLDAKYADLFKDIKDTKINFKVTDKAIEKTIVRMNETDWQFIKRMASHFNAMIFTDLTAEKPLLTIGRPESKKTIEVTTTQVQYNFDDATFQFLTANKDLLAKGTKIVAEDFQTVFISGHYENLSIGDTVKLNKKEYFVRSLNFSFVDNFLQASYTLVGKTAFIVPIESQKNLAGRIFRAQVKKVEKDKIQAHFVDIDQKFDSASTAMYPFATPYSSTDGSGWYVMPEVDDYVRVSFPVEDTSKAFAMSSINSAPLKEPKNKSLKAPGGKEILLTDKSVEIIAEHQKTFILLDKDKGINIVSAKDINISADGNISFEAKGKLQISSNKEINVESGSSHVKVQSSKVDMGGNNIIVGE